MSLIPYEDDLVDEIRHYRDTSTSTLKLNQLMSLQRDLGRPLRDDIPHEKELKDFYLYLLEVQSVHSLTFPEEKIMELIGQITQLTSKIPILDMVECMEAREKDIIDGRHYLYDSDTESIDDPYMDDRDRPLKEILRDIHTEDYEKDDRTETEEEIF